MSVTCVSRRLAALALVLLLGGNNPVGDDRADVAVPDGITARDARLSAGTTVLAGLRMALRLPATIGGLAVPASDAEDMPVGPAIIEVEFSGASMPDKVRLTTPDGTEIEPIAVEQVTADSPSFDDSGNFRAGLNGTSLTGLRAKFAIGFPFGGIDPADRPAPIRIRARFQVPDMAHYAQHWTLYRVVILHAAGTADEERLEMLPPRPDIAPQ